MSSQPSIRLRPEIEALLDRLRSRIRRYVVLEGTALTVVVLGTLFWVSMLADWVWFEISKLELPVWFRMLFSIVGICLVAAGLTSWIVLRLFRNLQSRALALVLERRFPELDDRLITAVESAGSVQSPGTPLTSAMLERTIDDVARASDKLQVGEVFERKPLRRALIGAVVIVLSIAIFGVANSQAMERWWRAFNVLHPADTYWNRDTELRVHVVAQPGEQIKQFKDANGRSTDGRPGEYKHPRGADITLIVDVPQTNADGKALVIPDRIELQYRLADGRGSGRAFLSRLGDRQFKHSIAGLQDGLEFWIKGGDFANRAPYRVTVVEPPRVDSIVLENLYPEYTGLNTTVKRGDNVERIPDKKLVLGTQVSVPRETELVLEVNTNKPVVAARLLTSAFEIRLAANVATLTLFSEEGASQTTVQLPPNLMRQPFASEGTPTSSFGIPFYMSGNARTILADREQLESQLSDLAKHRGIPLPSDMALQIYLEDIDDISGADPARVIITGVADVPPSIEARLRGVSNIITRKATIPIVGRISDDYGIAKARFEYRLDDVQQWQETAFAAAPKEHPRDFVLRRDDQHEFEQFDVLKLNLDIGRKLTLTVYAEDGDNLNGPNTSRSEAYSFKIVSDEELLSLLYGKELNLRRQFEQIIQEVEGTKQDLVLHRGRVVEGKKLRASEPAPEEKQKREQELKDIDTAVAVTAERSLHQIRKNASETAAIEISFGEILEELVNNAVHTQEQVNRIEALLIKPLHNVNEVHYPNVDRLLGLYKLANDKGNDPTPAIDQTVDAIDEMLRQMKGVLKEMRDLVEFHEMVKELKDIIGEFDKVGDETKRKQKEEVLKKLKGLTD